MTINELQNEKIAILGLSREGISSGEFLFRHGIPFTVLERQSQEELGAKFNNLKRWNCKYHLESDHLKHLHRFSFILRSPGVPLFLPEILKAKQKGIQISSNSKLFMELSPTRNIIGVTSTKGKGTTCKLIESVLRADQKDVYVGGNIGLPPLDFIDQLKSDSYVVLELSSFQLQDFEKSPHIAVILGIAPDHLAPESEKAPNYHKSMTDYLAAKKQLVKFQDPNDFIVMKKDDRLAMGIGEESCAGKYFYSRIGKVERGGYVENEKLKYQNEKIIEIGNIKNIQLRGRHHLENICAALSVSGILDCTTLSIQKGLFNFQGYEHRLEFVTKVNGISYYDDSAATNPEPAMAAIDAFTEPLIVILGGSDKGQDYTKLGEKVVNSSVKVAYLIGDMADKIAEAILSAQKKYSQANAACPPTRRARQAKSYQLKIIEAGYPKMHQIVQDCTRMGKPGDVILLSSACASFDMFENYRERGDLFKKEVRDLVNSR